ncbi:DUF4982 domain-containing protein [Pelagicoccus sp. NFK12]|uniref:DUF4982 domain-containing protein n=1 Tax=Pelagicoccus enzymogenes TaxID=2773457 RepID=A0A927IJX0_9BACT|nr:glycoside hydrolase family 2 TIM barrel-domain containing protein [Pelagicoccus enzymogenes]MBD5782233.1 DUF4982 domain-containing protein [Pelagicoccus enzymogenes]
MASKNYALAFACLTLATSSFAQGFGDSQSIREWNFRLGDDVTAEALKPNDPAWRPVIVPHDWSVEYPASPDNASCTGYLPGGIGWYETELEIDPASDKRHYLYFEGVYNRSQVFVNGDLVGERPNGYVSFLYDITPHLDPDGSNQVSVRVDHSLSADSRWYTGSGIYRPVHHVTANQIHFAQWGTHYQATVDEQGHAILSIETAVQNHQKRTPENLTIEHTLYAPEGHVVATKTLPLSIDAAERTSIRTEVAVPHAQLWGIRSPHLYRLESELKTNGKRIDQSATNVGIRTIAFDPNHGFALNGENMKIKGVCLHHDAGVLGAAVPKQVWRERLQTLKEIGVNGIRMSHNPQATDLYDLCDEMGFLVMDEAFDEWETPKKKWIKGWNKGEPGFQGAADFFHEWGERDLEAMVLRDRNHPSIIMWSIGNEVDYPNDPYSHPILDKEGIGQQHVAGYQKNQPHADRLSELSARLAAVVRKHDTSRPVTAALAGAVMSNETEYPSNIDVVGYNYTENRYAQDHAAYPERILYGSETRHDLAAWKAVTDNDFIFGQFIWTGFDYLGESGAWPSRGFTTGMVDISNKIKARGHFRRALWSDEPVAYLGTYQPRDPKSKYVSIDAGRSWNYEPGQTVRVVCYTNGDSAQLYLDGKKLGKLKPYDAETAIIHWDIPYKPGKLEVITYRGQQQHATDSLAPARQAADLRASIQKPTLDEKYDIAVITLEVLDQDGQPLDASQLEVTCEVEGPGELVGLENASRDASENFHDNVAVAQNGTLVAYVRATADHGTVAVHFTADRTPRSVIEIPIQTGE